MKQNNPRWPMVLIGICGIALGSSFARAADDALREVKFEELVLKVPAAWKQQPPTNNLRLGQFEIPAVEGDQEPAELTVFNFGFAGGVKANVDRWIEQFERDERKVKITTAKCPLGQYVFVDISGTYKKPIGPPVAGKTQPAPGFRVLGIILSVEKKGNYFLKLTGPEKTVSSAVAAFRASIGGNEKDEKPLDSEKTE
jgi:gluconolactonase